MELRDSAMRVQEFIRAKGFSFEVRELRSSTRTAREALTSGRWVVLAEG
jgi:hypothetical protein